MGVEREGVVIVGVRVAVPRPEGVKVKLFVGVAEGVGVTATMVTTAPATGRLPKTTICPFVPAPAVTLKV